MAELPLRDQRLHEKKLRTEGDDRTPAQRDRDRVLYSSAFRRLAEVTQVVSPLGGHLVHNRLTHSLRVAQVGRRLAEKLIKRIPESTSALDPDVVECACLAHDIGHPPFGHCSEEKLNDLAKDFGGFEGNAQSFRILTELAFRSEDYRGLDLTRASLAAVLKYPWLRGENASYPKKWGAYESERRDFGFALEVAPGANARTLEAELMDWADDVTYAVHDIEDFYRAGRVPLNLLAKVRDPRERQRFFANVFERRKGKPSFANNQDALKEAFTDVMLLFPIEDAYTGERSHRAALRSFTGNLIGRYINAISLTKTNGVWGVTRDTNLEMEVTMFKELIWTYIIEAPSLATQQHGQRKIVEDLFDIYAEAASKEETWALFPDYYRERLEVCGSDIGKMNRVCIDLIASLTEGQAIAMHGRLSGNHLGSSLEDLIL
jgi:dGTPase